jgi:hypothetical protein
MSQAAMWAVVALCAAAPAAQLVWVQRRRLRGPARAGHRRPRSAHPGPTFGRLHLNGRQFEVIDQVIDTRGSHHGRCRPDVVQRYLAARPTHQAVLLVVEESADQAAAPMSHRDVMAAFVASYEREVRRGRLPVLVASCNGAGEYGLVVEQIGLDVTAGQPPGPPPTGGASLLPTLFDLFRAQSVPLARPPEDRRRKGRSTNQPVEPDERSAP